MLVTLKQILSLAEEKGNAVGAFNTPNLESIRAVLDAAQAKNQPVILMHAQIHEEMGLASLDTIGRIMLLLADKATVPVCVHLDHGTDLSYIEKALALGFTSVMYDGSTLGYEENYANTAAAVGMASRYKASVEGEIGSMGAREGGETGESDKSGKHVESQESGKEGKSGERGSETAASLYTDPETAAKFSEDTGIDALACAFGTAHGLYVQKPKLDFKRLEHIRSLVHVPLVMHGGSGVSDEDYQRVIHLGIRKINYYTYMAKAGGSGVAAMQDMTFYHDIAAVAKSAIERDVFRAMSIFERTL